MALLILIPSIAVTSGVEPIALPYRQTGQFLVGNAASLVQIEVFVDLICEDAPHEYYMWKRLLSAGQIAPAEVALKFHVMASPSHSPWSFTASVGAQTASAHGKDAFFSYIESVWGIAEEFLEHWGDAHYPLSNLTEAQVVAKLAPLAMAAGVPTSAFYHGMTNRSTIGTNPWAVARGEVKLAASRQVASSPWYFVNGVPYFEASSGAHLGDAVWLSSIRRLIAEQCISR